MPRLDEIRTALLESLSQEVKPGEKAVADPSRPFASIARVAIGLVAEPRIVNSILKVLDDSGLLEPGPMAEAGVLELDDLLRSSKIRLQAKSLQPLQKIARWAVDHGFDADQAATRSTESIRAAWRGLNGVGPTRADSFLLFGLGRPTYPVDRGTYRILVRHGWIDSSADYDEARSVAESIAPGDPQILAGISVAFERIARVHCKPSMARCDLCPLLKLLPPGGYLSPEN